MLYGIVSIELMLGAAGVLLIGFLGRVLGKKTSIPYIIWLMFFGLLLGPILGLLKRNSLIAYLPVVIDVIILLVLFNAGLNINLRKIIRSISRGLGLALTNFILSFLVVFFITYFLLNNLIISTLLSLIVAGLSLSVVSNFSKRGSAEKSGNLVELEATIEEPLSIIFVLVFIGAIILNNTSLSFVSGKVISEFSIGAVLGVFIGMAWTPVMGYLQRKHYDYSYVASLAIAFLLYVFIQEISGSGPISVLAFGIVIANGENIFKALKYKHNISFNINKESKSFNELVTFLTTSFFFVYFGALVVLNDYIGFIFGITIALALVITKYVSTRMALYKSVYHKKEKDVISSMVSRGTGAAVMAALPISYAIKGTGAFIDITFAVIFATIFMNSILISTVNKTKYKGEKENG
ncbi:MAG: sodium/hydrogen exchanger [Candidatus Parvarchaeum acidophilus ARMAN-5]|uniref:Sodium/hydrogen exchanger n=1 Tax=Candidatus Parvarchaeum acidophilus ARMAN-5 TaxID=662762 RepID=D6GWH2_PARA5|nr:MAG: sodium/hydrogen exchanger [Candidatus Parvarchaeum acidophilus ARMAN-5]